MDKTELHATADVPGALQVRILRAIAEKAVNSDMGLQVLIEGIYPDQFIVKRGLFQLFKGYTHRANQEV